MNSWWGVAAYLVYGAIGLWLLWGAKLETPAPGLLGFTVQLCIAFLGIACWPALVVGYYIQASRKGRPNG